MPRSFWLYLYGTPNIVGSTLALFGLGLFFSNLISDWWFFIVAGLYLVGYRLTPTHVDVHLDRELAKENAFKAADKLVKETLKHVSQPVAEALERVWVLLQDLMKRLDRFDPNDKIVHDIQKTATHHLPDLLEPYLSLPPAFARFHPVKGDKTARDLLLEQLNNLEKSLNTALTDALNEDVDNLRIQGEFLNNTFAHNKDWLQ